MNQRVLDGLLARGALGEEPGCCEMAESGNNARVTSFRKGVVDSEGAPTAHGLKNAAEGGMILLTDFWEFPGGLNELFLAWNLVPRCVSARSTDLDL